MPSGNRRLMWHGMCLFLIGLLTGFVEQRFTNMRMALAAHLEGVMNGTFRWRWAQCGARFGCRLRQERSHTGPCFTAPTGIGWLPRWLRHSVRRRFLPSQAPATAGSHGRNCLSPSDLCRSVSPSLPPPCLFCGACAPERPSDSVFSRFEGLGWASYRVVGNRAAESVTHRHPSHRFVVTSGEWLPPSTTPT
jgi:hypothetical protein